jgi:bacillithiol biosynthesis cysteine-adding enzyme BshC
VTASTILPFDRYPGLPALFRRFLEGMPELYADPPTLDAAERRGRELSGHKARTPVEAYLFRGEKARRSVEDLAAGRAVAVVAGHQVGLFTGPLFTLTKAFDTLRVARELSARGVAAVPVFWALTDDHDLEEIARTARPGREKPELFTLEGADRSNRRPVGSLPLPEKVGEILDAFAADSRSPEASALLERMRARYAAGTTYGRAFQESLLDLAGDELVILDPSHASLRPATAELFRAILEKREAVRAALQDASARIEAAGFPLPVVFRPEVFPFFAVTGDGAERRRPEDPAGALEAFGRGEAWASSDVLTRPLLKSWLLPCAATILGPAEIAYHAQSLALFPLFDLKPPVLLPRSFLVPIGPPERRAMEALGISKDSLLRPDGGKSDVEVPGSAALSRAAQDAERDLAALEPELSALDPTLVGALETTRRKVAYQIEQLGERMRKAAERKDETAVARRKRLQTLLLPEGSPAERLYPPLVPVLAYGPGALDVIRAASNGSLEGAEIVDLGAPGQPVAREAEEGGPDAG